MSFVAAAIGGAGLLTAGASIYGANKASDTQADAAQQAAQLLQQQRTTNNTNAAPFISGGQGASNLLQSFYGIGPNGQLGPSTMDSFLKSPDYQFALSQGTAALDNSAASKGGLLGGNQVLAATQYGQGLATQNLQNYMGRLSGLAGQGIQAAGNVAGVNTYGANQQGQDVMGAGTAQAAGINGMVGGLNTGVSNLLTAYKGMGQSSYGSGGASAGPMTLGGPGGPVPFS